MSNKINSNVLKQFPELQQVEMESQQVCNLQCKYCYIPKNNKNQQKINMNILKSIVDGSYLKLLYETYGDKLQSLSLWGTEPTLNLDVFLNSKFFEKQFEMFPNLNQITTSSNFQYNQHKIIRFYKKINELQKKHNKYISIQLQISLDNYPYFNDKQRGEGVQKNVEETLYELSEYYGKHPEEFDHIIIHHYFKPTIDGETIKEFQKDTKHIKEFTKYFHEVITNSVELMKGSKYVHFGNVTSLTLQLPENYTSEEQYQWYILLKQIRDYSIPTLREWNSHQKIDIPYLHDILHILTSVKKYYTRYTRYNQNTTCSQGDTMLSMSPNGDLGICHHTMFLYDKQYRKMFMNSDIYNHKQGDFYKQFKLITPNKDDEYQVTRMSYQMRQYHDYFRFKKDQIQVQQLSIQKYNSKMRDKLFLEDELYLQIFQSFIQSRFSCPVNQLLTTGSLFIQPFSILNIWMNGQFKLLFKEQLKRILDITNEVI